jgi:hypothetical protein
LAALIPPSSNIPLHTPRFPGGSRRLDNEWGRGPGECDEIGPATH